jgi:hypothetical protein
MSSGSVIVTGAIEGEGVFFVDTPLKSTDEFHYLKAGEGEKPVSMKTEDNTGKLVLSGGLIPVSIEKKKGL